jgi:hypothetical protein
VGSETVFRGVGSLPGGGGDDWAGLAGRRWEESGGGENGAVRPLWRKQ